MFTDHRGKHESSIHCVMGPNIFQHYTWDIQ